MPKLKYLVKALLSRFPIYVAIGFVIAMIGAINFNWGLGVTNAILVTSVYLDMAAYLKKAKALEKNQ
jgi:hypothetical protein